MKDRWVTVALVIVLALAGGFLYNKYRIAPGIKLEELELVHLNGEKVNPDDLKGQTLFINFFATWCGPCVAEMPLLEEAQHILAADSFRFILISDEAPDRLKAFQQRTGLALAILHSEKKLKEYDVYTLPTSYVFNKTSEMTFKKTGEADWSSENMVKRLRNAAASK